MDRVTAKQFNNPRFIFDRKPESGGLDEVIQTRGATAEEIAQHDEVEKHETKTHKTPAVAGGNVNLHHLLNTVMLRAAK